MKIRRSMRRLAFILALALVMNVAIPSRNMVKAAGEDDELSQDVGTLVIHFEKKWEGDTGSESTRPESLKVTLYKYLGETFDISNAKIVAEDHWTAGEEKLLTNPQTVSGDSDWKCDFDISNTAMYEGSVKNPQFYKFAVVEESIDGYVSTAEQQPDISFIPAQIGDSSKWVRQTDCAALYRDAGIGPLINIVAAKTTANNGMVIWSEKPLTKDEREFVFEAASKINGMGKTSMDTTTFISGTNGTFDSGDHGTITVREEIIDGQKVSKIDFEMTKAWCLYGGNVYTKASGDEEVYCSITNTKQTGKVRIDSDVTVKKVDEKGNALSGVGFSLMQGQNVVKNFESGENGEFTISTADLSVGEYTLAETAPKAGYAAPAADSWTVKVRNDGGIEALKDGRFVTTTTWSITVDGASALEVVNTKQTGSDRKDDEITIIKTDEQSRPLGGVGFTLSGNGFSETYTTAADGTLKIGTADLDAGTYTLAETAPKAGYAAPEKNEWTVVVANDGGIEGETPVNGKFITTTTWTITVDGEKELNVVNTKQIGSERVDDSVTVTKVGTDGKPLENVVFTLSGSDFAKTYVSDGNVSSPSAPPIWTPAATN